MNRVISLLLRNKGIRRKWEEWDTLCRKCGICCYEKSLIQNKIVIYSDAPCEFLDTATNLCAVFSERFRKCPDCRRLTFFHLFFISYLPPDCGYMKYAEEKGFRLLKRDKKVVFSQRNNREE